MTAKCILGENIMNDLTVIVAVYNTVQYLAECLDSIFNQSYDKFDVVLVDDCSTDGSAEMCEEYKKKYKERNVVVLHNDINLGVSATWERAVCYVKSKWIFIVDSDDIIHPNLIESAMQFVTSPLGESTDILEVGTVVLNNKEIEKYSWKELLEPCFMVKCGKLSIKEKSEINGGLGFSKNLIRRDLCRSVDYLKYKERWPRRFFNDGLYTVLLYQKAKVIALLEDTVYIHRNRVNSTGRVLDRYDHLRDWLETDEEMYRILKKNGEYDMSIQILHGILNSIMKLVYYIDKNDTEKKEDRAKLVCLFKKYYRCLYYKKEIYKDSSAALRISWAMFSMNSRLWGKTIGYFYFEYGRNIFLNRKCR